MSDQRAATLQEIGQRIRAARVARGWSQPELGRRLGCAASTISHWECARRVISVDDLFAAAQTFGIPVVDLLPAPAPSAGSNDLHAQLTEAGARWVRMYPFANWGFWGCAGPDARDQLAAIADGIAAGWGETIADTMLAVVQPQLDAKDAEIERLRPGCAPGDQDADYPHDPEANICVGCPGCLTGGRCIDDPPDDDPHHDDDQEVPL